MRQHSKRTDNSFGPLFKVIRGLMAENEPNSNLDGLTDTAWTFVHSALWNCTQFTTKEINAAKGKIAEYLRLSKQPRKAFLSFCQRVLLARYYLNITDGRFLPLPSAWLDRSNEKGFASTKGVYDEVRAIRESLPGYKAEIKALAEAVLEFSEEPTEQNFLYWRNYFTERQTPGLLNLFQVHVVNSLFSK